MNEIEFTTTSSSCFDLFFNFVTFNFTEHVRLHISNYYQFHFKNKTIQLTGYLLKASFQYFPKGWKLESSLNGVDWNRIDFHVNDQQLSQESTACLFSFNETILTSFLRLTFLSTSVSWVYLEAFEIFGEIQDVQNLQSLISIPNEITILNRIDFPFKYNDHIGLFDLFKDCSIKTRNEIFAFS